MSGSASANAELQQVLQDAQPASPTGAHGRGPRLYVGGVPDEITEEDIVEHFNKWGQVVDCYFPGRVNLQPFNDYVCIQGI